MEWFYPLFTAAYAQGGVISIDFNHAALNAYCQPGVVNGVVKVPTQVERHPSCCAGQVKPLKGGFLGSWVCLVEIKESFTVAVAID
jgi:hypothetical protein